MEEKPEEKKLEQNQQKEGEENNQKQNEQENAQNDKKEEKEVQKVEQNEDKNKIEENKIEGDVEENKNVKNEEQNEKQDKPEENENQNNEEQNKNENEQQNDNKNKEHQNDNDDKENAKQNQNEENKINENEENNNQVNQNVNPNLRELPKKEAKIDDSEKEKIILSIKEKIKELNKNFNFYIKYHDLLFLIIKTLEDIAYEKITNTVNEGHNFVAFFKNSSDLYSKFAHQIKNSNNIISTPSNKPKMTDNFLIDIMKDTQNIFYENLSTFSNGLKQNIIAKGPLSKLNEKSNKIESIRKSQFSKYYEIDDKRRKFEKKYMTFKPLFNSFLPEESNDNDKQDNNNPIPKPSLIDSPDFIYVIKSLIEEIKNLIIQDILFVIGRKESLQSINDLFIEINTLVKESIIIYIQESKIFFNIDVTKKFEEIEQYFKKLEEDQKDNKALKIEKILSEYERKDAINGLLKQFYDLLNESGKVNKELIPHKDIFLIDKYVDITSFIQFLINIAPQPSDIPIDDLIIKKLEIKRDPGFFSKWRDAVAVLTKQQHLIIYDKPNIFSLDNIAKIFEIDKISFRKKEDSKKPFLFEIIANVKGKVMNFKGNFLFDGLNNENIEEIYNFIPH